MSRRQEQWATLNKEEQACVEKVAELFDEKEVIIKDYLKDITRGKTKVWRNAGTRTISIEITLSPLLVQLIEAHLSANFPGWRDVVTEIRSGGGVGV